jgi:fibronectin-binding autotransporter adhesin
MSTISTTVTHNIYYGTGQTYLSPLTITNTGAVITSSAGIAAAVQGSGGGTLSNAGTVIGSASGVDGVLINGPGGTVVNSGVIEGASAALDLTGAGVVTNTGLIRTTGAGGLGIEGAGGGSYSNSGTILATNAGDSGVVLQSGGDTFTNTGTIQAYLRALYIEGVAVVTNTNTIWSTGPGAAAAVEFRGGTLTNSGTIVNNSTTGAGVRLDAAGTVANSGFVQGYAAGINESQPGAITNTGTGTIVAVGGNGSAVLFEGIGSGSLTNQGTIISPKGDGVNVQSSAGGTVSNSGLIEAAASGVYMLRSGLVTNSSTGTIVANGTNSDGVVEFGAGGTLINDGSIIGSQPYELGVEFIGSGGTVINRGTIQGYITGLEMSGSGVLINSGVIRSVTSPFIAYQADVMMTEGGSFTNTQSGFVSDGVFLASGSSSDVNATVVDAGTIVGGIGLNLNSQGFTPTYYGSGTVFLSGTVSGASFAPIPILFGGTNALLVLEHGYDINGVAEGIGSKYPHTVELLGSASSPVTVDFSPSRFTNFGTVAFAPGAANDGTLGIAATADVPGTISHFTGPHDVIDLGFVSDTNNDAIATLNTVTSQLTVTGDGGTSAILQLDPSEDYSGLTFVTSQAGSGTDVGVLCFCAGTRIATPSGEVPVERLRVGDEVLTQRGVARKITWIGAGRVLATRGQRSAATPVIVRKGALAHNVPSRHLRLTKGHSLYLDGVLVPVEELINHRSILWDDRAQEVELYHIELASHDVLVADGAPAESYRDDGNRWLFRNTNKFWQDSAQPPCAPVLHGGPVVDALWRRLLERAGPRPGLPLTRDPDLHVRVDGWRVDAATRSDTAYVFRLPRQARSVHIASRAAVPAELGLARDRRMLGVGLRRIELRQGTRCLEIELTGLALADGFHAYEPANGLCWTDGNAALPTRVLGAFDGARELILHVGATTSYVMEGVTEAAV